MIKKTPSSSAKNKEKGLDQNNLSYLETAASENEDESAISRIKRYYYTSLLICFSGVIGCYSCYALLQESL